MASGVFTDDCIPCTGFDDAHALLKTGGHFVSCIREYYHAPDHPSNYRTKIDQLVNEGKFELVKTWTFERGPQNCEDPEFATLPQRVFLLKRLD